MQMVGRSKKPLLPFLFFILLAPVVQGQEVQRYGHCDVVKVWRALPAFGEIEKRLDSLEEGYQRDLAGMMKEYRERQDLDPEKWRTWSPEKRDSSLEALRRMEERILGYKDRMERSILEEEKNLFAPVRERIRRSIAAVAERRGFAYVFDSSSSQLLHAEGAADITEAVIAQLGTKNRKTLRP